MNKNYFKAIAIHAFMFAMIFSISVIDSSIIPILICLLISWPFYKMINNMSIDEFEWAFGINFLKKKFVNNLVIKDICNE